MGLQLCHVGPLRRIFSEMYVINIVSVQFQPRQADCSLYVLAIVHFYNRRNHLNTMAVIDLC